MICLSARLVVNRLHAALPLLQGQTSPFWWTVVQRLQPDPHAEGPDGRVMGSRAPTSHRWDTNLGDVFRGHQPDQPASEPGVAHVLDVEENGSEDPPPPPNHYHEHDRA